MKRWKRIKIQASYYLDEPEKFVNAVELVKNRLYRYDENKYCDAEGKPLNNWSEATLKAGPL